MSYAIINKCVSSSFLYRGQISIDYEREFPCIDIGPRLVRRCREESHTSQRLQVRDSCLFHSLEIIYILSVSRGSALITRTKKTCFLKLIY